MSSRDEIPKLDPLPACKVINRREECSIVWLRASLPLGRSKRIPFARQLSSVHACLSDRDRQDKTIGLMDHIIAVSSVRFFSESASSPSERTHPYGFAGQTRNTLVSHGVSSPPVRRSPSSVGQSIG